MFRVTKFLFVFLFCFQASADEPAFAFFDPHGYTRAELGVPFEEAFNCQDQLANFIRYTGECSIRCTFYCRTMCAGSEFNPAEVFYADECGERHLFFFTDDADEILMTWRDYALSGNNWIRRFLQFSSKYIKMENGQIHMMNGYSTMLKRTRIVEENGEQREVEYRIPARALTGEFRSSEDGAGEPFVLYYDAAATNGLRQIIKFGLYEPMFRDPDPTVILDRVDEL